jgi:hypothetical protein
MLPIAAHVQTPPPIHSPVPKIFSGLAKQLGPVHVVAYVCYGPAVLDGNGQSTYLNHQEVRQLAEAELRARVAQLTNTGLIAPTIAATLQDFSRIPIVNPNNSEITFRQFQADCTRSLPPNQDGSAVHYRIEWTPRGLTI